MLTRGFDIKCGAVSGIIAFSTAASLGIFPAHPLPFEMTIPIAVNWTIIRIYKPVWAFLNSMEDTSAVKRRMRVTANSVLLLPIVVQVLLHSAPVVIAAGAAGGVMCVVVHEHERRKMFDSMQAVGR